MVGKTNVGSSGKLFAVIAVTYPEGSICTCSDGTKTMKAKDTSGKALFNVAVGEWTVTATDGSSTASHAISIKADGQIESVTLSYELYIFKAGTGSNTTWTTGDGTYGTDWNTSGTDYLRQTIGGYNGYVTLAYLYADNAFDATNYTTLVVTGYGYCDNQTFGVSSSKGGSLTASGTFTSSSSETTYTADITRIRGNAYFVINSKESYATNTSFTITNIYFK